MEISKIQKFLSNMHKFDPKKEDVDYFEDVVKHHVNNLEDLVKKHDGKMDVAIGQIFLDLLQFCNIEGINIEQVIKDKLNFGL
jgi:bifunctional pyridoxal-dependent enzyme with beta-cystathionase and maltose regulon repressor activities